MEEINSSKELPKRKISKKKIFIVLLIISLAFNIFFIINALSITGNAISNKSFKYINPTEKEIQIDSNSQETKAILHYQGLISILKADIQEYDGIENVGVFIQDIKTGTWSGINERDGFAPASLLKIPIMMAILKKVDRGDIQLGDKITIIQEDIDSRWGNLYEKGAGAKFTILELLTEMVLSSDNTAKNVLKRQLSQGEINSVFSHVGIPNPYLSVNNQTVSPRDFIRFFRSLYYFSYLSPELSEKALDLTTDSEEEDLISKGLPAEIQVAHKFGIIEGENLHDCGIVYYKPNPYFLCVMTKNLDTAKSKELIQKISKDVYDYVSKK